MLLKLALLFFSWAVADGYELRAIRRERRAKEERERMHQEQMREIRRRNAAHNKKVTRTYARDEKGRFVVQETVEDL